jgi:hypothetical protein
MRNVADRAASSAGLFGVARWASDDTLGSNQASAGWK